jgi:hypothetical protein
MFLSCLERYNSSTIYVNSWIHSYVWLPSWTLCSLLVNLSNNLNCTCIYVLLLTHSTSGIIWLTYGSMECNIYGFPGRNVPDFGRVFLMVKYTDITQNIYVQSWTVTEIMAREKCGLLAVSRIVPISWHTLSVMSLSVVSCRLTLAVNCINVTSVSASL